MIPGIVTAILLIAFLGGCVWAYSPRRRAEFGDAERLALDDAPAPATTSSENTP
jgi:cytochrome c oxidase cbb3-type subunit IV